MSVNEPTNPEKHFAILELQTSRIYVSKLHTIRRAIAFEALKLSNVWSGSFIALKRVTFF